MAKKQVMATGWARATEVVDSVHFCFADPAAADLF